MHERIRIRALSSRLTPSTYAWLRRRADSYEQLSGPSGSSILFRTHTHKRDSCALPIENLPRHFTYSLTPHRLVTGKKKRHPWTCIPIRSCSQCGLNHYKGQLRSPGNLAFVETSLRLCVRDQLWSPGNLARRQQRVIRHVVDSYRKKQLLTWVITFKDYSSGRMCARIVAVST